MKPSACPPREHLIAYALGRLPEDQLRAVAEHAQNCPECQAHLGSADSMSDALIDQLRQKPPTPVPFDSELSVAQLVPRLKASFAGPNDATCAEHASNDPAVSAEIELDLKHILSPPQGADEIGRLGPYRVLRVLGAGGMGLVLLAEDPKLRRLTALKVMKPAMAVHPTARERFLREARATAQVRDDHIVTIYQVDEENDVPFLAMELLEGETLADYLQRAGSSGRPFLPSSEVVRISAEIAAGLAAAHEKGLIHRDIKPSNIWLEKQGGRVKIVDFGLARLQDDTANLTQAGNIVGTPAYMSPEQANGLAVDARSDLFSLGSVLYQLCTGQTPFSGTSTFDLMLAVVTKEPRPIAELNSATPPALITLVNELMAKSPDQRPATACAVLDALKVIDSRPSQSTPSDATLTERPSLTPIPAAGHRRRSPVGLIFAAVVLLAAAGGAALFLGTKRGGAETTNPSNALASAATVPTSGSLVSHEEYMRMVDRLERGMWQMDAVNARMRALNPGFPGIGPFQEGYWMYEQVPGKPNKIRRVVFCSDTVTDISPLAPLTELKRLTCSGSKPGLGKLADLSPLKDLKLIDLDISCTGVSDLSPLKGMGESLKHLYLRNTRVKDLTPLKSLTQLAELECDLPSTQQQLEVLSLLTPKTINGVKKREFIKTAEASLAKKQ
jgi:serine/threonine protein kinase